MFPAEKGGHFYVTLETLKRESTEINIKSIIQENEVG
jgi:hypothetical protein